MKVKFLPNGEEFEIDSTKSVLQVAQENGIHIKSVCKGVPSCAECRIQIAEGEHNVFPPSHAEVELIGTAHFVDHSRLACQLKCFGDIVIDLKEQVEKMGRKPAGKRPRGGRAVKEEGESQAVTGNIMHEVDEEKLNKRDLEMRDVEMALFEEEKRQALERIRSKKGKK